MCACVCVCTHATSQTPWNAEFSRIISQCNKGAKGILGEEGSRTKIMLLQIQSEGILSGKNRIIWLRFSEERDTRSSKGELTVEGRRVDW